MKETRLYVIAIASAAVLLWYFLTDPNGGAQLATQLQGLVGLVIAAPVVYYLRRFFTDQARGRDLLEMVRDGNRAAGYALAGLYILTGLLFLAVAPRAIASDLPSGAQRDLPILQAEINHRWPDMPMPSVLGALIEQESHWKAHATLKTAREEGVGYGQFTRAYRADGSLRFDALDETRQLDPALSGWSWATRYDATYQLRAVVVKNRDCFHRLRPLLPDDYNALAMCDAAYNGGLAGVYAERRLCAAVAACDPGRWFGHVELHSTKSRVKWRGYGASAFEINRHHVRAVLIERRPKYVAAMGA